MEKKIENLRWKPMWTSHLGCLKGCIEYLGLHVSDAWLFGATGHAFVINIHEVVCPSGPTAWNTEMLFKLGTNVGYVTDGDFGRKSEADFAEKQKHVWEKTKRAIDEGVPCYGWELDIPEYYVVSGYDDEGYYFSGPRCDSGKGPKPWRELGDSDVGVLEMYSVKAGQPTEDARTVKEALHFALEHATSPPKWTYPRYKAGLGGYHNWIQALENGTAHTRGLAYNAAVWAECRNFAVKFLKEAKERLPTGLGPLFDEAIGHYEIVAVNLKKLTELFPFPPKGDELQDGYRCESGLGHLRAARESEDAGLHALRRVVTRL